MAVPMPAPANDGHAQGQKLLKRKPVLPLALRRNLRVVPAMGLALPQTHDDLRHGEHPDCDGCERQAVKELDLTECEAWRCRLRIDPHGRQKCAERGGKDALGQRAAGQGGDQRQRNHEDGRQFHRPCPQRKDGECWRKKDQNEIRTAVTRNRGIKRCLQRPARLA